MNRERFCDLGQFEPALWCVWLQRRFFDIRKECNGATVAGFILQSDRMFGWGVVEWDYPIICGEEKMDN